MVTSYEGGNNEEELELVPIVNQNKKYNNTVSDSNIECNDKSEENIFKKVMMKSKQSPRPTSMLKWFVQLRSYKLHTRAMPTKSSIKNLNFLINLAMVSSDI